MRTRFLKSLQSNLHETDRSNNALNEQDIRYYTIVCSLKQNETAAVRTCANDFINVEDNLARVEMMSFHLAEYFFRQKNYTEAVRLYEHAGIDNLDNREIADMKFHEGYGYFTQNRFDKAKAFVQCDAGICVTI